MGSSANFPLNFPINAGNPSPLRDIASAAAEIAKQTGASAGTVRFLQDALDGLTKSGLSTKQALSELAKANGTVTPGVNSLAKQLLGADAAFTAASAGAQRFGNSIRSNVVAPVTAASGAIRVLEGGQSIRVVENLLAKTLGLGPAFQAAFPIFGAIAMTEMIGQMVEKVGKLYNEWDPVIRAQERALGSMKELNSEYSKLSGDSLKRVYDDIENRPGPTGGRANRLRAEGRDAAKDAVYQDAARIQTTLAEITAAQKRVTAGTVHGSAIAPGTRLTRDAQAAQVDLQRLDAELENARLKQKDDQLRAKDFIGEAGKVDRTKAKESAEGRLRIEKEIETIQEHSAELQDKAKYQDFGHIGEVLTRRAAKGRDYDRQLNDLDLEEKINPQFKPDYEKKRAVIGQSRKDDTDALNAELLKAISDQADSRARARSSIERELAKGRATMVQLQGERASAIDLATGRVDPESTVGISRAAADRQTAIRGAFQADIQPLGEIGSRIAKEKNPEEQNKLREQITQGFIAATGRAKQDLFKSETQRRVEVAGVDKKRSDTDRQIEDIETQTKREGISREASQQQRRIHAEFSQPGQEGSAIVAEYQSQIRLAQAYNKIDLDRANKEDEIGKKRILTAQAAADLERQTGNARLTMETQIDELRSRESQRQTDSHASTFASGIMAAATHSGEQFGRSLGRSIGQTMLENFGKNYIFQKGGPFEKLQGTVDPNSPIGKITHETGLFREESPLNAPVAKFDTTVEKFGAYVGRLPGATPAASAGTAASFGTNVPGYSNFGSGTNGKYGAFSGATSILKSIEDFFYRKPMPLSARGQTATSGTVDLARPLTEHITTLLGGSGGEGLSGRGGFEGIAGAPASDASKIQAEAQLIQSNQALAATNTDLTAANKDLTNTIEYVASGGTAGEMPGGVTVTPTAGSGTPGIPGLSPLSSDIAALTGGGANASAGLGVIGAAIPAVGAIATAATALSKLTGIGQQGHGEHAGVAGGGGNNGDGAGISIAPAPTSVPGAGNINSAGYSNVYNPDTGQFDVQTPSGATIPGVSSAASGITRSISTIQKGIGKFAGAMANPFAGAFAPDPSQMSEDVAYGPGQAGGSVPTKGLSGVGALGFAAAGADIGLGAMTAVSQFQKGGARGALGGTSAVLGTAAALTSAIPVVGQVLGIAALGTSLVKGMLGDPRVQRQKQISKNLFLDQYQAPEAQNVTSSTMGTYADIGQNGNVRTSSLSPYARTTSPYLDLPYRFNVPGTQTSQFGGGAPVQVNNNYIQAMDASSFESFLTKNSTVLAEGVAHGLTFGQTKLPQAIRNSTGQG